MSWLDATAKTNIDKYYLVDLIRRYVDNSGGKQSVTFF